MRTDYVLYAIGGIFLVVACYTLIDKASLEKLMGGMLIYSSIVFVLVLFGITAIIFGLSSRPRKQMMPSIDSPLVVEPLMDLTRVKGIGQKRVEELKSLGIVSVVDLSTASAEQLAKKLQISSKITQQWIKEARDLLLEK